MEKLNFQKQLLLFSVLHDPSEIILICWFDAKINISFYEQCWKQFQKLFQDSLMNGKFCWTAFVKQKYLLTFKSIECIFAE